MQNSGIYKLSLSDGSYYIGQSTDVVKRYKEHCRCLILNKHFNYKLQEIYNSTKELPKFTIVKLAPPDCLNNLETKYINTKDPLCLNILDGGNSNFGSNTPVSKYLTQDIELAFLLLVNNPGISHKEVAEFVGIDINTVHDISAGRYRAFTEMKSLYPEEYAKLIKQKANNTRGKLTVVLQHEDGRVVKLVSGEFSQFCKDNSVQTSNLSKLISGDRKSTMGWRLLEKYENI